MGTSWRKRLNTVWAHKLGPFWVAVAAGGATVFAAEALYYAHHQRPVIDEGTYLYKGLLFATGVYRPFQPNGPWMNHMPLSFLIPGYVQKWFGPGLDVGRYFSVLLAVIMLAGLWAYVRQLSDRRWAAAAVWAFAAMPAAAKIYSLAVSQVIVAAMLAWVLALLADEKGPTWRLAVAGVLAGLMVMTRLNMVVAWGLIGLFTTFVWRRRSAWFWGTSLLIILGVHALYWPRIVWAWARWLPSSIHLPPQFGPNLSGTLPPPRPPIDFWLRLQAIINALVAFPLAWGGLFAGMAAWAATREGRRFYRRALIGGMLLAWALLLVHGWASVGHSYCVDCFTTYTAFFAPLMVSIGTLTFAQPWQPHPRLEKSFRLTVLAFAALAMTNSALFLDSLSHLVQRIGFSAGYYLFHGLLGGPHRYIFKGMSLYAASNTFWMGVFLPLLLVMLFLAKRRRNTVKGMGTQWKTWVIGAGVLALLSPLPLLSNSWRAYDCGSDVLAAHRQATEEIARFVPPGAKVYWAAYPPTVLLRARGIMVFPQQLNDHYSFRQGGDPQVLASWGYWNQALAQQWLAEADVVITDEHVLLDGSPPPFEGAGFAIRKEIALVPECLGRQGKLEIMTRSKP